ncbi:unnamed protein product [Cuscuta campestris]|uniref:Integrase catalytic domain-containing protein n=1 Tax=Cuscuta campestris TaxID=132261 RepID=A0A484LN14_9ASTE|nr:unnamed protein product [Cuscuta campestris]
MKIVGANVHFQKLEAKCSSPVFYQTYLEMIDAQELSEFLHLEIGFKYEEVLEFYKNGKISTIQSKKNPERTIQLIKSTVGGTKTYDARYWLHYLSSKGETKTSSTAEDEGSLDNVLIVSLKKSSKRKRVVSPSPSHEEPHTLALVNLDEEEEVPAQGELQKKKKRRISSPTTSGNANPDDLVEKESLEEASTHNQCAQQLDEDEQIPQDQIFPSPPSQAQTNDEVSKFIQLYYDWRAWKVGNSADQLKTYEDLHLEYLATSPTSEFEADDEDPAVYKPILSKPTEDQTALTTEAQENAATPQQEQIQTASKEELLQSLQLQVQEILTTTCEISSQIRPEIPEKSSEDLEKSTPPETTTNEAQEEPAVEVQRSFEEAEREAQIARLEVSETPVAIFEQPIEDEVNDSLSRDISNCGNKETEEESVKTLKINEEEAEQRDDAESLSLQLFHKAPFSNQVTNFHFHSSSATTPPDEIPEAWTRKVQGLIESALKSQHASFRQEIEQMETRHNKLMEKSEEKLFRHFGTFTGKHKLEVIVQPRSPSQIPKFPIEVKQGELSYIPSHLNMTELILEAQQSNPENSIQHLSNTEFDGTEAVGTIASNFTNDAQTKERYNNLKRIQEECGVMQGIGEVAGSSMRKKNFINVCRFLRNPLSLRLFDHMFDVRPGSKETLGFVIVSSHQGRAFLSGLPPSNRGWKDKYVSIKFPLGAFPFGQNAWGKRMRLQVKPLETDDLAAWETTLWAGDASTCGPNNPAQSHQGTSQPIHSGELYINVDTMAFDTLMMVTSHTSEASQGAQEAEGGHGEEEAAEAALQRKRRRTQVVDQPTQVSNNEAEYKALLCGLRLAASLKVERIQVRCDSKLIVGHVTGEFEAKDERMKKYRDTALELLKAFGAYRIEQSWGIKHRYSAVRYPQTNGQVENTNRTIVDGLKKKIMECKNAWVEELPYILWTYRTTPRKAMGETPFTLTYGFEARALAETSLLSHRVETFDAQENEESLRAELHLIDERRERAYIRAENYRQQGTREEHGDAERAKRPQERLSQGKQEVFPN